MTWLALISRYKYLIGLGLLVSLIIGVWLYGKIRYNAGLENGKSQGVLACQTETIEKDSASSKRTREIVKQNRSASRLDDMRALDAYGLRNESN